ncbi:hypothetical protein F5B20DRAFT_580365 [Whalleya microplaca]|nr:hypothetical protein F5B20DRAFT_580365 [Whalleya microplaca]
MSYYQPRYTQDAGYTRDVIDDYRNDGQQPLAIIWVTEESSDDERIVRNSRPSRRSDYRRGTERDTDRNRASSRRADDRQYQPARRHSTHRHRSPRPRSPLAPQVARDTRATTNGYGGNSRREPGYRSQQAPGYATSSRQPPPPPRREPGRHSPANTDVWPGRRRSFDGPPPFNDTEVTEATVVTVTAMAMVMVMVTAMEDMVTAMEVTVDMEVMVIATDITIARGSPGANSAP